MRLSRCEASGSFARGTLLGRMTVSDSLMLDWRHSGTHPILDGMLGDASENVGGLCLRINIVHFAP
jgi:hypothetical protein